MKKSINYEIAMDMLREMPQEKKEVLRKALERNLILTSSYVLSMGEMIIYKQGWYLTLYGTRCKFSIYANDNDGVLEFMRKPNDDKLNKLYSQTLYFNECDFKEF